MASAGGSFPLKFAPVDDEDKQQKPGVHDAPWDPFTSTDWDKQRPTSEAIVRIKRLSVTIRFTMNRLSNVSLSLTHPRPTETYRQPSMSLLQVSL